MAIQRTRLLVLAMACLASPTLALAAPMRICTPDIPFPPFTYPDREGVIQFLLRVGAQRANVDIMTLSMPVKRCVAEMGSGKMHARIASSTDLNRASLRFPEKANAIDNERNVGYAKEVIYRVKESKADWDGQRLSNINGAVLLQPGFPGTEKMIHSQGLAIDTGGRTLEINLGKLLAGRGSVAIGFEFPSQFLFAKPEFAGKFDILPKPVRESYYFVAFSRDYYQQHSAEVERLWSSIAELRHQPEFEAIKQKRIDETLEEAKRQ